jgi:hypothetical protein
MFPDLSGLSICTNGTPTDGDDRHALSYNAQSVLLLSLLKSVAQDGAAAAGHSLKTDAALSAFKQVLGNVFLEKNPIFVEVAEDGDKPAVMIKYRKSKDEGALRTIAMSHEFLEKCAAYFAQEFARGEFSLGRAYDIWDDHKQEAANLFYTFPSMNVASAELRGWCVTDVVDMVLMSEPYAYIEEYLSCPWYFRSFMQAFDEMWPRWDNYLSNSNFEEFVTASFAALGWAEDPHGGYFVNYAAYGLTTSYEPTETDIELLRARFEFRTMRLCYITDDCQYHTKFDEFVASHGAEPKDSKNPERVRGGSWVVYILRTQEERNALLGKLEIAWNAYTSNRSLSALVNLVQIFNSNHYFMDGNGRFSMLLIQLHVYNNEGKFVYFWNHNPNGPCLAKYVRMIERAPRIPSRGSVLNIDEIKKEFERALETSCDALVHNPLPDLEAGEDGKVRPKRKREG